jgi:iron complex transport system permease protein
MRLRWELKRRGVRWLIFTVASLLTGAAVSSTGSIGYVGLLTPHLVRQAAGADNRLVIPASGPGGRIVDVAWPTRWRARC